MQSVPPYFPFVFRLCRSTPPLTDGEEIPTQTSTEEDDLSKETPLQREDPSKDDCLNILMIGNSFCSYYLDELHGMLSAAGIKAKVCRLYYSGCSVEQHWTWLQTDEKNYDYRVVSGTGTVANFSGFSLKKALAQENWDVVTLQQHFSLRRTETYEIALNSTQSYTKKLYQYIEGKLPFSTFYWQQTWAFQVGYDRSDGKVTNVAEQTHQYEMIRLVSDFLAKENNVSIIPSGDAWQLARANPLLGDNLTRDLYHDGETGGGQYLNACVWFEVLTQKSCLDNSFRPSYELNEEKVAALKEAAHAAVSNRYGANYAK